jgi:hypothetical protein
VAKDRRRPKWIATSKTFLFGAAVLLLGVLEWVSSNVEFTGDQAGQIISAIGIAVMILRRFTTQAVTVTPPEKLVSPPARVIIDESKEDR